METQFKRRIAMVTEPSAFLLEDDLKGRADEVLSGWALEILEETEDHYKAVTHYGYPGWIRKEQVKEIPCGRLSLRAEHGDTCIITGAAVDVLSEPRVQGEILETLPRGAFVEPTGLSDATYAKVVTAAGNHGYVPQICLARRKDNDHYLMVSDEEREGIFFEQTGLKQSEEIIRDQVTANAKKYLGTQYRWAGKTPQGIDCSGMVFMSYFQAGIMIFRDAKIRPEYPVKEITREELKPGDPIYFPGHVAMYLGEGKFIHSTSHRAACGVVINSMNPEDADFRGDLLETVTAYGSIF